MSWQNIKNIQEGWLTPVIPATRVMEIRGIAVQGQLGQTVRLPSQSINAGPGVFCLLPSYKGSINRRLWFRLAQAKT
jgi:hypothetical protein